AGQGRDARLVEGGGAARQGLRARGGGAVADAWPAGGGGVSGFAGGGRAAAFRRRGDRYRLAAGAGEEEAGQALRGLVRRGGAEVARGEIGGGAAADLAGDGRAAVPELRRTAAEGGDPRGEDRGGRRRVAGDPGFLC